MPLPLYLNYTSSDYTTLKVIGFPYSRLTKMNFQQEKSSSCVP